VLADELVERGLQRGQSNRTNWQCGTGRSRVMSGGTVFFT
jgi:hypothetical protein